ncbi:SDR family oxidoreductase [Nonomuraea sp. 3-1Str]|uniref:SDR family NAD(P)-dependent oxidoreductase n=1 Tax=Nonomuraea sp. 3-1Str TaxID=2929801 RepID=UPI0028602958|nr:SDR family oxidoreductase [Nonomuraea sp. 3-1Str]MDR8411569.1 SDR family oxidoreductase [Nonomuraea sp. 3-1Str]
MAALSPDGILLTGRVAVVTGAARGLGRAIAEAFAAFGAEVAVCDRVTPPGGDLAMTLDVRDPVSAEVFAGAVRERWGRVDILVNNAGGTFHAPFAGTSERGERTLIEENFTQVTAMIRRLLPMMGEGASIINVTSSEAHQAAPGFAIYAAMKAAVESLTRSLALELAPRGVRVNAIAPDALPTEGELAMRETVRTGRPGEPAGPGTPPFEPVRLPPLGRLGEPADAAAAAVFLAGDLSRFVTGTTLHVDGGIHAAGGWRRIG